MSEVWIYTLGSTLLVSLVAFIGIFSLAVKDKFLSHITILLVSLSAGALLGDAFIHILPEMSEHYGFEMSASLYILIGILTFLALEKLIHWHHCHCPDHHHKKAFVYTVLFGDGLHNFVDGLFIASSYIVDIHVGIATTIAVIFHEIPQEIGDFGVLVHGGIKKIRALLLNFASALTAFIGAFIGLYIGEASEMFLQFVLPFTAGGFIYIATTDLFPELHKKSGHFGHSLLQFGMILVGIGMMIALTYLELGHAH